MTRWIKRIVKLSLIVAAFFAVMLLVMANLGGNNPVFKEALESFASETTGHRASIQQFNDLQIFPRIIIDFDDLELYALDKGDAPVGGLKNFRIKMSFWSAMFGTGKIMDFQIDELKLPAGAVTPAELLITSVSLNDKGEDIVPLAIRGQYGGHSFKFDARMQASGADNTRAYKFPKENDIALAVNDLSLTAHTQDASGSMHISDIKAMRGEALAFGGSATIKHKGKHKAHIDLDLSTGEKRSHLNASLMFHDQSPAPYMEGAVILAPLDPSDLSADSPLRTFIDGSNALFSQETDSYLALTGFNFDLDLDIQQIKIADKDMGHIKGALSLKDGKLALKQAKGKQIGGNAVLDVMMTATGKDPATLAVNYKLRDANPQKLANGEAAKNGDVTGSLNAALDLKSMGDNMEEILSGLEGNMLVTGSGSTLGAGAVRLWSGGLMSAILPDFSSGDRLDIACAVMNFPIKDSIAAADPMVIDTKRALIVGTGTYNIAQDRLNLTLKPKSKELAVGRVINGVKVTGSIADPVFSPDLLELGAKIGGVLLGVVNPAMLALPLSDLGLSANSPCAEYLQQQKQE